MKLRILVLTVVLGVLAALGWGTMHVIEIAAPAATNEIPTTKVHKGKVTISVSARGELQGGNSEIMTAPMVGGGDLVITSLREPGEKVNAGDAVVEFDTTQQEFNLREAEADLAEAEQQVVKAQAEQKAAELEAIQLVKKAETDVETAELEVRKNPVLAAIAAKQNVLALEAAQNRLKQAKQDVENRKATAGAGVAIQQAAQNKAKIMVETAKRTIDSMTLKAKNGGYVYVQQNSNQNMLYIGQQLPQYQVGDGARAGQAVAQIPDLGSWEVVASIPELDRGHLSPGQQVMIRAAALPGREFTGRVKSLGGTSGNAWDRRFECRIALEKPSPELRPGMTSNLIITAETLEDALWVPSQALFESDGRAFVYRKTPEGFQPHDVKLIKRSESQAVITGIKEGEIVALSSPDQQNKQPADKGGGVMKALPK
jgi:HlyD family secretion protein